ncbi:helix-turn-helix transcriptional regulator [Alicyclobacillus tolerans]|uniref:helix-turn-helix domain-containing protein n=1 Tax=Alicyclobacillus tolerans TaxID=90970 RepID=UPI001F392F63|nr:helix-turn-helix transcriptional regulator [Alicyclobacillus tolerans]MCF8566871.1 helix-turn-helix transcriptional regulator [Alicyclobacillus tolerans]
MQNYTEFGLEARRIMLLKNIKMTEIARQLGISVTYVGEIFKGTRPGEKYKARIAEILEMKFIS